MPQTWCSLLLLAYVFVMLGPEKINHCAPAEINGYRSAGKQTACSSNRNKIEVWTNETEQHSQPREGAAENGERRVLISMLSGEF